MSSFNLSSLMQTLAQAHKMDHLKQEVHELREEVTTLRAEVEKLTNLVSSLTVQRKSQPLCIQPPQQQRKPLCIQLPQQQYPACHPVAIVMRNVNCNTPISRLKNFIK